MVQFVQFESVLENSSSNKSSWFFFTYFLFVFLFFFLFFPRLVFKRKQNNTWNWLRVGACACVYEYNREGGKEGGQTADVRRKVKVGSMCVCVM